VTTISQRRYGDGYDGARAGSRARHGVRVTSVRYNGTIHDFLLLNTLADTPTVRAAIHQINDALRAALS
jgi:acetyl esterase